MSERSTLRPIRSQRRPCFSCGYDIGGLAVEGACPECATPIARSVQRPLLRSASERYLFTLRRGILLTLWGVVAGSVTTVTCAIAFVVIANSSKNVSVRGTVLLLSLCGTVAAILVLAGWRLMTARDPSVPALLDAAYARVCVRLAALVLLASTLSQFVLMLIMVRSPSAGAFSVWYLLMFGSFGLGAVALYAQLFYLRWLAFRVPHRNLVNRTETLMWLFPLLFLLGSFLFMLGPLIAVVLYCGLLLSLRTHVQRALDEGPAPTPGAAAPA